MSGEPGTRRSSSQETKGPRGNQNVRIIWGRASGRRAGQPLGCRVQGRGRGMLKPYPVGTKGEPGRQVRFGMLSRHLSPFMADLKLNSGHI